MRQVADLMYVYLVDETERLRMDGKSSIAEEQLVIFG